MTTRGFDRVPLLSVFHATAIRECQPQEQARTKRGGMRHSRTSCATPCSIRNNCSSAPASIALALRHRCAHPRPLDKRCEARQVLAMGFGPFRVKAKFGEQRIATSAAAMVFVRGLDPSLRISYHWKVAERMIHFAWMSAEDEALAEQAFQIALETDALLLP
jgi:hypothetical protein